MPKVSADMPTVLLRHKINQWLRLCYGTCRNPVVLFYWSRGQETSIVGDDLRCGRKQMLKGLEVPSKFKVSA